MGRAFLRIPAGPRLTRGQLLINGAGRMLGSLLRHGLADVLGEHVVDERLIPDALAARGLPELLEHPCIDTDGDQLPRRIAEWRTPDPAHRPELIRGRLRNVGEVNLPREKSARAGPRSALRDNSGLEPRRSPAVPSNGAGSRRVERAARAAARAEDKKAGAPFFNPPRPVLPDLPLL